MVRVLIFISLKTMGSGYFLPNLALVFLRMKYFLSCAVKLTHDWMAYKNLESIHYIFSSIHNYDKLYLKAQNIQMSRF